MSPRSEELLIAALQRCARHVPLRQFPHSCALLSVSAASANRTERMNDGDGDRYRVSVRSAADLRRRWLEKVPRMVTRPGMWAADGPAFDVLARGLIADLCFLDEREQDLQDFHEVLAGTASWVLLDRSSPCSARNAAAWPRSPRSSRSSFTGWVTFASIGCSAHHPEGLSEEQQQIAARLRTIESGDPSQMLGPPRGDPRR